MNIFYKYEKVKNKLIKILTELNYMEIVFSSINNIEITAKDVSKGNVLKYLCDYLSLSWKDTITFGDSNNDISMFEMSGLVVDMNNVFDEVKQKTDVLIIDNELNGVAKIINYLIG